MKNIDLNAKNHKLIDDGNIIVLGNDLNKNNAYLNHFQVLLYYHHQLIYDGNIIVLGNDLNKNNAYLKIEFFNDDPSIEYCGFELNECFEYCTIKDIFERCEKLKKKFIYDDFKVAFVELKQYSEYKLEKCIKDIDELIKKEEENIDICEDEYPSLAIIYDSYLFSEEEIFDKVEKFFNGCCYIVEYYLDSDNDDYIDIVVFSNCLQDILNELNKILEEDQLITTSKAIIFKNVDEFNVAK